jgi:hypothetical protein
MPHIVRQLARIASARAKGGVDDREYCVDFISHLGKSVFTIVIVAWRIGGGVALYAALSVGNVMAFTLRYAGDRYAGGRPVSAAARLSIARQLPPERSGRLGTRGPGGEVRMALATFQASARTPGAAQKDVQDPVHGMAAKLA